MATNLIWATLAGAVLERLLYRRLYRASHLDQVLFSIGLVIVSSVISAATHINFTALLVLRTRLLGLEEGLERLKAAFGPDHLRVELQCGVEQ